MYKIFVDDSGHKKFLNSYSTETKNSLPVWNEDSRDFLDKNFFVLCGVHIANRLIPQIDEEIKALKKQTFWTHQVEIKSTYMRHRDNRKKYYLQPFNIDDRQLNLFWENLFDLIHKHRKNLKLIATVFDKRQYKNRDVPSNDPLLKSTQVLFERIHYTWKKTNIVFDQMESSLRKEKWSHWKMLWVLRSNDGMDQIYVENYSNILDIEFQQSKNENFLQIADICSYTIRRQFMQFGKDWLEWCSERESKKYCETYSYFDKIRCNFHCSLDWNVVWRWLVIIPDFQKINWNILWDCDIC